MNDKLLQKIFRQHVIETDRLSLRRNADMLREAESMLFNPTRLFDLFLCVGPAGEKCKKQLLHEVPMDGILSFLASKFRFYADAINQTRKSTNPPLIPHADVDSPVMVSEHFPPAVKWYLSMWSVVEITDCDEVPVCSDCVEDLLKFYSVSQNLVFELKELDPCEL